MPKLVDHSSYRKQLLNQCFDLFARRGYSALTMRQIAEELEVSTGTLYHYFPTKEALFQQLVEEVTQQTLFEAASQVRQHATLEERLTELLRFLSGHEEDVRKQFLVMLDYYQHRDLYGENAKAILQEGANRYRQAVRDYIGLTDPQLCFLLQSQIDGLLMLRMMHGTTVPFIEQARPFVEMLIAYLRNTSGAAEECSDSMKETE